MQMNITYTKGHKTKETTQNLTPNAKQEARTNVTNSGAHSYLKKILISAQKK